MATRNYTNTATEATLTGSITSVDTSLTLASFAGFPPAPFTAAIDRGEAGEEVVLVTNVGGSTVTVTRGYDGTTAKSHGAGAPFLHVAVARDYAEANVHASATTAVHGVTGSVVGTTGAQTLANKTLAAPTISNPAFTGTATGLSAASASLATPTITDGTLSAPAITGGTQASPTITTPTIKDGAGATVNHRWVQMTQAAYNALGTKDPATLYVIVG